MADLFESYRPGLESPATRHYEVELESGGDTELDPKPRALFVNTDGDIDIVDEDGTSVTYHVVAGMILPFRASAIGPATTAEVVAWY